MRREFLISFAGHAALLAAVSFFTDLTKQRDARRPQVITVQLLPAAGTPQPQPASAKLIEPAPRPERKPEPKPQAKPEPKPQNRPQSRPQTRSGQDVIRRQGLGAKVEGAEALGYNYYLAQMLDKIAQNWEDPYSAQTATWKATVMFVIERDGTLSEIKVEKSSGDRTYDLACLRAVQVTEKLPPLPPEFTAPRLKIHLEFER
ncbi:MAG: TonB family protein [candidate division WOR-3 bacterium]